MLTLTLNSQGWCFETAMGSSLKILWRVEIRAAGPINPNTIYTKEHIAAAFGAMYW